MFTCLFWHRTAHEERMCIRAYTNTGWALARMSTHASRSKGEGWVLTRVPPQIARNAKNGEWVLTRAWALTRQNTVQTYSRTSTEYVATNPGGDFCS